MEVRKHNARKITETFEYATGKVTEGKFTAKDGKLTEWELVNGATIEVLSLKGFKIAGEDGKISLTYDERDKQQVVDLLKAMAKSLENSR